LPSTSKYNLGISIGLQELPFQKGVTKARRKGFELKSSDLWGGKNELSTQLQIQLMGFETKSVPFFLFKVFTLFVFSIFFGAHLTTK
jgi:hypothetical protein